MQGGTFGRFIATQKRCVTVAAGPLQLELGVQQECGRHWKVLPDGIHPSHWDVKTQYSGKERFHVRMVRLDVSREGCRTMLEDGEEDQTPSSSDPRRMHLRTARMNCRDRELWVVTIPLVELPPRVEESSFCCQL